MPYASVTLTTGCVDNTDPDAPATGCVTITSLLAAPAVPVAVNVTGEPDSEPEVAVRVFAPAVVPSVQAGDVATPEEFVDTTPDDARDPPPVATANVTDTLGTALPAASLTNTLGAVDTAAPAVAD